MLSSSLYLDSDVADVSKARAGDKQAFSNLVRRHSRQAYHVARSILDSHAEADAAVEEAWVRIWRSRNQFDHSSSFSVWLLRIVANTAEEFRQRGFARLADIPEAPPESPEKISLRQRLTVALTQLSLRRKEIVVMHDVYGVGHQEIASTLDMGVGAVRAELANARRQLQAALANWRSGDGSVTYSSEPVSHG